jgi:hypothetical protein
MKSVLNTFSPKVLRESDLQPFSPMQFDDKSESELKETQLQKNVGLLRKMRDTPQKKVRRTINISKHLDVSLEDINIASYKKEDFRKSMNFANNRLLSP